VFSIWLLQEALQRLRDGATQADIVRTYNISEATYRDWSAPHALLDWLGGRSRRVKARQAGKLSQGFKNVVRRREALLTHGQIALVHQEQAIPLSIDLRRSYWLPEQLCMLRASTPQMC
jgi:hypothetical protein